MLGTLRGERETHQSAVMGEAICIVSGGQTEVDRAGLAWASEEYQRDLKKFYAQLEEPRGWGGPEVTELREGKWERRSPLYCEEPARPTRMCWRLPKAPSGKYA
jgi:hypothetical protein